jgi:hypothetical protein
MSGADGSTGVMSASTWQYWTVTPLTALVMSAVDVTRPPVVGRLIAEAGIRMPSSAAHRGTVGEGSADAVAGPAPSSRIAHASTTATAGTARRRSLVPLAVDLFTSATP